MGSKVTTFKLELERSHEPPAQQPRPGSLPETALSHELESLSALHDTISSVHTAGRIYCVLARPARRSWLGVPRRVPARASDAADPPGQGQVQYISTQAASGESVTAGGTWKLEAWACNSV